MDKVEHSADSSPAGDNRGIVHRQFTIADTQILPTKHYFTISYIADTGLDTLIHRSYIHVFYLGKDTCL